MGNVISFRGYTRLEARTIEETLFGCYTEVSSKQRNAIVESVTDETFASAYNLIKSEAVALSEEAKQDEEYNGDGWIVKRHEPTSRVTVKLCNVSHIFGFDIDTTGFSNLCPSFFKVEGLQHLPGGNDGEWVSLIEREKLIENSHNFFQIINDKNGYSRTRLTVTPGGGIARFRTYGEIVPDWSDVTKEYNLASANFGARIVRWSDIESANKPDILMDNGTLTSQGWLTPRSREQSRNDFMIIQLAAPGSLNSIVIDTTGFAGNSPAFIRVEGCNTEEDDPYQDVYTQWIPLTPPSPVNEDDANTFPITSEEIVTHIRLTLLPDGGIQQIKCFGFLKAAADKKSIANGKLPNFIQYFSTDTLVATPRDERNKGKQVEEDSIVEKPAIQDINLCSNNKLSPSETSTPTTLPIDDVELYEETIIEELNASTTQLLTPKKSPTFTPQQLADLAASEKAAVEQLNTTSTQIKPPVVGKDVFFDASSTPVVECKKRTIVESRKRKATEVESPPPPSCKRKYIFNFLDKHSAPTASKNNSQKS